jgi:hypothetical protein
VILCCMSTQPDYSHHLNKPKAIAVVLQRLKRLLRPPLVFLELWVWRGPWGPGTQCHRAGQLYKYGPPKPPTVEFSASASAKVGGVIPVFIKRHCISDCGSRSSPLTCQQSMKQASPYRHFRWTMPSGSRAVRCPITADAAHLHHDPAIGFDQGWVFFPARTYIQGEVDEPFQGAVIRRMSTR